NLLSGVLAAQGEAHTRSRGFRAEAHREQDVRWLDGSARAGRSARHCESTKVERDHHCLTFNAFKAKIARVREAVRPAAVDDDVPYSAKDASLEPIAKGGDAIGLGGPVLAEPARGTPESHSGRHVFRSGTTVALVMPAEDLRLKFHVTANHQ